MSDRARPQTLPALFESTVERFPGNVLVYEKTDGAWQGTSYAEMRALVHRCAAGLMDLGLQKGDRVALIPISPSGSATIEGTASRPVRWVRSSCRASTMKMVRGRIEAHYQSRIVDLHGTAGTNITNAANRAAIHRLLE